MPLHQCREPVAAAAVDADLAPRRREAKKHPLLPGNVLQLTAPSLRSDVFTSRATAPSSASPIPPRRPASPLLLDALSPASGRAPVPYPVSLIRGIQTGKDQWARVWQAEIDVDGKREKVVLKLFVEALFPRPTELSGRRWSTAEECYRAEGDSYAAFSHLQGAIVPFCYGVYDFDLPFGETVGGIVLEDLTSSAIVLPTWIQRLRREKLAERLSETPRAIRAPLPSGSDVDSSDGELDDEVAPLQLDDVQLLLDTVFAHLQTLHNCGRGRLAFQPSDILLLRQPRPGGIEIVLLGFAYTTRAEEREEEYEELRAQYFERYGRDALRGSTWHNNDRHFLRTNLKSTMGTSVVNRWEAARSTCL
ncbi:hypothetical protein JCM10213_002788 [Rhodosporidiobolus nylandii]